MNDRIEAAKEAIEASGGASELARKLLGDGVDKDAEKLMIWRVLKWVQNGVPPEYIIKVEQISGVSRHRLNPRIYPPEAA